MLGDGTEILRFFMCELVDGPVILRLAGVLRISAGRRLPRFSCCCCTAIDPHGTKDSSDHLGRPPPTIDQ